MGQLPRTVSSLATAASTMVTFSAVTNSTPGTWNMYAIADALETISESDETNNVAGPEDVIWGAPAPGAFGLVAPADGATGVSATPTLEWRSD